MAGVRRIYGATQLTGVNIGSLADIDATILNPDDMAIAKAVTTTTNTGHALQDDSIYFYRFADVSDAQDVPKVIKPNTAGATGRWLLISPAYFMENLIVEPGKKVVVNEIQSNNADLTIAYNDAVVYITVGDSLVTIDAPTLFNDQLISSLSTGTAPFVVNSQTQVSNLNVEFHGGQPITNISLLDDSTNKYSVLPLVTDAATVYPTDDRHLVTKKYVDELAQNPSDIDHGYLSGRLSGEPYEPFGVITNSGSGTYTNATNVTTTGGGGTGLTVNITTTAGDVTGVALNTKGYGYTSASTVTISGAGNGLAQFTLGSVYDNDDHTQYIRVDGTRAFTGVVSGVDPISPSHLSTRNYVTTAISSHNTSSSAHNTTLMSLDGSARRFTVQPPAIDAALDPYTIYPNNGTDNRWLTTKSYVDTLFSSGGLGSLDITYLRLDAGNSASGRIRTTTATPLTAIGQSGATLTGEYMTRVDLDNAVTIVMANTDAYARLNGGAINYNLVSRDTPTSKNTFVPSTDYHLITKVWAENTLPGLIFHDALDGLDDDDHPQYILANSARDFSAIPSIEVALDPVAIVTANRNLATKGYVDNAIISSTVGVTSVNGVSGTINLYEQDQTLNPTDLTFANNGSGTPDTITTGGSVNFETIFNVGDIFVISGTTSNNGTYVVANVVSTTVIELVTDDALTAEGPTSATLFISAPIKAMSFAPITNGTTFEELPIVINNGISPTLTPSVGWELVTKKYVDDSVAGGVSMFGYVDIYGNNSILYNQRYIPMFEHDYFSVNNDVSQSRTSATVATELVAKGYVDKKMGQVLVNESTDQQFSFLDEKVVAKPSTTYTATVVPSNIGVSTTTSSAGYLERYNLSHGGYGTTGLGFVVAKTPGSPTSYSVVDSTGSIVTLTETVFSPPPSDIQGVVEIGVITNNTNGTLSDGTYTNGGSGYTSTGGSGVGATFNVIISGTGTAVSLVINQAGSGYAETDSISVAESTDFSTVATGNINTTVTNNGDAEWYIERVYGEVSFVEILAAGTGYAVGEPVYFGGNGSGAVWEVATIGGSGEILTLTQTSTSTELYSNVSTVSIGTASGVGASLAGVIAGEIVSFHEEYVGEGYTSEIYTYKGTLASGGPVNNGFTITGQGTGAGKAIEVLDLEFINPNYSRLELQILMNDVSNGNTYTLRVNGGVLELVQTN